MGEVLSNMVNGFLSFIHGFLLTWGLFILFALLVYFTWKLVRAVPNTKPKTIDPRSDSSVRWADVAGAQEARAGGGEVVQVLPGPQRVHRLGGPAAQGGPPDGAPPPRET